MSWYESSCSSSSGQSIQLSGSSSPNSSPHLLFPSRQYAADSWTTSQACDLTRKTSSLLPVFEVRFKCHKREYVIEGNLNVNEGDFVKVEAERGYDIGIAFMKKDKLVPSDGKYFRILSHACPEEMSTLFIKLREESQALGICREMAAQRGLEMTIADVEYQFDGGKLTVVFCSHGHVDFRKLVVDLHSFFDTHIWMQKVSPSEAVELMRMAETDNNIHVREEATIQGTNQNINHFHNGITARPVRIERPIASKATREANQSHDHSPSSLNNRSAFPNEELFDHHISQKRCDPGRMFFSDVPSPLSPSPWHTRDSNDFRKDRFNLKGNGFDETNPTLLLSKSNLRFFSRDTFENTGYASPTSSLTASPFPDELEE